MRVRFTKMQGAGNDFVVLDATRDPFQLSADQVRRLGDLRFGVGEDQILVIEKAPVEGIDFGYRIFNGASGDEVEHCGNGARCFVRYALEYGLTPKRSIRVATMNAVLELHALDDGRVEVDMGAPRLEPADLPFDPQGLTHRKIGNLTWWTLPLNGLSTPSVELAAISMGNPHAVLRVEDVDSAPVAQWGPAIESHARFARKVNVGFLQLRSPSEVALRVHERDAGETLACGTGACAAVVAGIASGWLEPAVEVHTRGGKLRIAWARAMPEGSAPVRMTGPAETVFEGEIEL